MKNEHHTVGLETVEGDMYVHKLEGYTRAGYIVWHASESKERDGMPHPVLSMVLTPDGTVVTRQGKEHLTLVVGKNMTQYWQRIRYASDSDEDLRREADRFAKLIAGLKE